MGIPVFYIVLVQLIVFRWVVIDGALGSRNIKLHYCITIFWTSVRVILQNISDILFLRFSVGDEIGDAWKFSLKVRLHLCCLSCSQGWFYAANWLILANFDPNFVIPQISVLSEKMLAHVQGGPYSQGQAFQMSKLLQLPGAMPPEPTLLLPSYRIVSDLWWLPKLTCHVHVSLRFTALWTISLQTRTIPGSADNAYKWLINKFYFMKAGSNIIILSSCDSHAQRISTWHYSRNSEKPWHQLF